MRFDAFREEFDPISHKREHRLLMDEKNSRHQILRTDISLRSLTFHPCGALVNTATIYVDLIPRRLLFPINQQTIPSYITIVSTISASDANSSITTYNVTSNGLAQQKGPRIRQPRCAAPA